MKKSYFFGLFACLMLFAATVTAQVSSITDLYGKYQFTADMELLDNSYADQLSNDCEVVISEDENYIAKIVGFAGATNQQNINAISTEQEKLKVTNPNTPQLWSGLYLANENGDYPYGVYDSAAGEWTVESYGLVYYTYNPDTKTIEVPAFSVVTCDHANSVATIVAKFTNVKMNLLESVSVEVADISGDWAFKAGSGAYDTMEGSVIPTEFALSLAKSGDDNKNYTATMTIDGYNAVTFAAAFDGNTLVLPYDSLFLDEENGIRFAPMYGPKTSGTIEFKSSSEDKFSLYSGFSFASDVMGKASDEVTDSLYINGEYHQWYISGVLSRPSEAVSFSWDGTYNVRVASSQDVIVADGGASGVEWSSEFQMVVQYWESIDAYYVTNLFGLDLYGLNYGGFPLVPGEDGKSATIELGDSYYGTAFLKSNGDGTYLALTNANGVTGPINLTLNEDGTVTIDPVFVQIYDNSSSEFTNPVVFYQNMTAEKDDVEEEPAFDWAGTYALTSTVETDDATAFPSSFYVTVTYNETYDMYLLTELMGIDVTGINYGGLPLTPAEDGKSATLSTGYIQWIEAGVTVLKLRDINCTTSDIQLTLNDDGTVSVSGFSVMAGAYGDESLNLVSALYTNVVLEKDGTVIEPLAPLSVVSVTPSEAVESLSEIVIEFSDEISGTFDIMGMTQIYLGSRSNGCSFAVEGTKLTITPFYAINAAGEYGLYIPSGLITRVADNSAVTMDGTTVIFTVIEPEPEPVDYTPTNTGTRTYTERNITSVTFSSSLHGEQSYTLSSSEQLQEYLDITANEKYFVAAPGETVTLTVNTGGSWVHHYVYIDVDSDGFTASIAEGSEWAPAGDLFAYSLYNNGGSSDEVGCYNSVGTSISGNDRNKPAVPSFEVPFEEGIYRMRIKQDWCSIDPNGDSDSNFGGTFSTYGGQIIDLFLSITTDTAIEDVVEETAVEGIYDFTGRKIKEITGPGIYIVNGKKVLVK